MFDNSTRCYRKTLPLRALAGETASLAANSFLAVFGASDYGGFFFIVEVVPAVVSTLSNACLQMPPSRSGTTNFELGLTLTRTACLAHVASAISEKKKVL